MNGSKQASSAIALGAGRSLPSLRLSRVWGVAAVLFPVCVVTVGSLTMVDLAYHVRAGQLMLASHHVLRTDPLTFSALGRAWLDQQWAAQILMAISFRLGGWFGLTIIQSVLTGAILLLVLLACRAAGASVRAAVWLTLGAALVLFGGFQLRPQLFGAACFTSVLFFVASRHRRPWVVWLAIPATILWANLHGSFFLAPVVLGLAALEDRVARRGTARSCLIAAGACLVAPIANPFGVRIWSYVIEISTNPLIRRAVDEWQPPSFRTYAGATFLLSLLAVAAYLARRRSPTPWTTLLELGVFAALGLTAVRGTFWWGMAAPVILARLPATETVGPERPDPDSALNWIAVSAIVLVTIYGLARWAPYTDRRPPQELLDFAPLALTDHLRSVVEPGDRVVAAQAWGSWFELALPRDPMFVDSRWEVIPVSVWSQYEALSQGRQGWQQVLDRWHVDAVVVANVGQEGLRATIGKDAAWQLAYRNDQGAIFIRSR